MANAEKNVKPVNPLLDFFVVKYPKQIIGSVIAIAAVGAMIVGLQQYKSHAEKSAQDEMVLVVSSLDKKLDELSKAENAEREAWEKKNSPKAGKGNRPSAQFVAKEKTPAILNEKLGTEIQNVIAKIKLNPDSNASVMAAMKVSSVQMDYKDAAAAKTLLQSVGQGLDKKDLFFGLLNTQLATIEMDLKEFTQAATRLDSIVSEASLKPFHSQALFRSALCYLESGDFEKAENKFRKLEADFATSHGGFMAKSYRRLVALKKAKK
jgi:predicted negative regulator of RcsB-dependent stress response